MTPEEEEREAKELGEMIGKWAKEKGWTFKETANVLRQIAIGIIEEEARGA